MCNFQLHENSQGDHYMDSPSEESILVTAFEKFFFFFTTPSLGRFKLILSTQSFTSISD